MKTENITITEWQRQSLGFALEAFGKAMSHRDDQGKYIVSDINKTIRLLNEFVYDVYPAPTLTEEEASLSSCLHTYQRKYMDNYLSIMLYRLISENRGKNVWYSFIKSVIKNKYNVKQALREAREIASDLNTTDDSLMYGCLEIWNDDGLEDAIKEIKSWS
jgi:hypothetical protein